MAVRKVVIKLSKKEPQAATKAGKKMADAKKIVREQERVK